MADYVTASNGVAVVRIPAFRGLLQYGTDAIGDPRFADESVNAFTQEGALRPVAACEKMSGELKDPIETLARLHRRFYTADAEKDVIVAAAGGQLYWRLPASQDWKRMPMPPAFPGEEYASSRWSWVTYEINPEGSEAPVDVLLMSNAKDGMICIRGDDMTAAVVETPKKFGVIARCAERVWGGAIDGDPDLLMYSAPYDPFDWAQNNDIPEDGAGDVLQPSWDGDSFTALCAFGSQLLAFKRTRIWRILGTHPGEYVFKEQYGGGAPCEKTVSVDGTRVLMLGRDGVCQYNGESVNPFQQEYAQAVFERMNTDAMDKACACMWRDTYYCALALDESPVNNAVLVYNTAENTWLLRQDVAASAFLPTEDALYFAGSQKPGRLYRWQEDCMHTGTAQPMRWVSPWLDLGLKHMTKSGFKVYLTVECKQAAELLLSVETEKKKKTKRIVFQPSLKGSHARQKRVSFGGSGRRFRLHIESEGTVPWCISGGMQAESELDAD